MAKLDPLVSAVTAYVAARWDANEWRQFGRDTGTDDILMSHPRLYRSLDFNDPDYPDAAAEVLERVLREAVECRERIGREGPHESPVRLDARSSRMAC